VTVPGTDHHRAFGTKQPLSDGSDLEGSTLPRVLRETTTFLLMEPNIRTEGIFRIPANIKLKECLREAYDRNQQFIIWKDNGVTLPVRYMTSATLAEIEPKEAYGVHMAASLIKLWYSELREPIFPQSTYPVLREQKEEIDSDAVINALSPVAQEILHRHLLPLLAAVAAESAYNKMTAENLAVCLAPALVCGTDAVEDAKMSSIVKRFLTNAIEQWDSSKVVVPKKKTVTEISRKPVDDAARKAPPLPPRATDTSSAPPLPPRLNPSE